MIAKGGDETPAEPKVKNRRPGVWITLGRLSLHRYLMTRYSEYSPMAKAELQPIMETSMPFQNSKKFVP